MATDTTTTVWVCQCCMLSAADDECLFRTLGYEVPGDYECECETCSFSTAQYYEYPRPGTYAWGAS